jgi:hypothetical protein
MVRDRGTRAVAAVAAAVALGAAWPAGALPGPRDLQAAREVRQRLSAEAGHAVPPAASRLRALRQSLRQAVATRAVRGVVRVSAVEGDVAVDPAARSLDVVLTLTVDFVDAGTTAFNLLAFLPVTAVEAPDGTPVPWATEPIQGLTLPRVDVEPPSTAGESRRYVVRLAGVPDCSMSGPIPVNLCAWGKVVYLAGDLFLPGTLFEDFATSDLRFTLPAGDVVAATGIVTSVTPVEGGREVHHVEQPFPSDTRSFGIAPYQAARIPWGTGHVGTFTLDEPKVQPGVAAVLSDMKAILEYYSGRFGAFVFPKMDACQVSSDAGAAFGWPALLWIPDSMWRDHGGYRTSLFAHELGHQWFPDTLKNDDSWGAWLSEGFAEFMSISYVADSEGDPAYAKAVYDQYAMLYTYFIPEASDYGLSSMDSMYVTDGWVYQIVTYYKGAIIAHLLESLVGRDVFDQAVRAMYADLAGKMAWYDTYGLEGYLEAASGMDLSQAFTQWVFRKGYPVLTVGVLRETAPTGTPRARIRVGLASSTRFNNFVVPVRLTVVTDVSETPHDVVLDQADQEFAFDLDGRLLRVRVDPDGALLKRVNPALEGDMDLSGEVDGIDLLYTAWAQSGSAYQGENFIQSVDFNRDGVVDDVDLGMVVDGFGRVAEGGAP